MAANKLSIVGDDFVRGLLTALLEREQPFDGWKFYSPGGVAAAKAAYDSLREQGFDMAFPLELETGHSGPTVWDYGLARWRTTYDVATQQFVLLSGSEYSLVEQSRTLPGEPSHWREAAEAFVRVYDEREQLRAQPDPLDKVPFE